MGGEKLCSCGQVIMFDDICSSCLAQKQQVERKEKLLSDIQDIMEYHSGKYHLLSELELISFKHILLKSA